MGIIAEFWIKQHDLQPYYPFQFENARQEKLNMIGSEIRFTMVSVLTGEVVINRQQVGIVFDDEDGGDDIALGAGHYEWQAGETDVSGKYTAEFEITPISGGKFTKPVRDSLIINIKPDIDQV